MNNFNIEKIPFSYQSICNNKNVKKDSKERKREIEN